MCTKSCIFLKTKSLCNQKPNLSLSFSYMSLFNIWYNSNLHVHINLTHLYGHGIYLPFTDTFWTYAVIYSLTTLLYMPYRPYLEGSNSNSCPFLCRFSLKQIRPKNKKSFTTSGEYILSWFCCQAKNGEIKIPEKPYTKKVSWKKYTGTCNLL